MKHQKVNKFERKKERRMFVSYVVTARYEDEKENEKVWKVEEDFESREEAEKTIKYLKNHVLADAKWEITPK
ncbi:hypothetical protein ABW03_20555 [Bacillus altitudinis]|nr:hypothetical protein ABW03_20555 [Bacillus altitudinis]